jgi:hypothetical protein
MLPTSSTTTTRAFDVQGKTRFAGWPLPVELPTEPEDVKALWKELLDLADEPPVPWILIGAQMVALHVWRANGRTPRISRDGDVLVDVLQAPTGTRVLAEHLADRGFELDGPNRLGQGHEFSRGGVRIDILAPDNLGLRADLRTLNQATTLSVPGGTQALARAETIDVRLGERTGAIPVPNLLGAIVIKFEAIAVDDVPDAQESDVASLLSLVTDRDELRAQLTRSERHLLQAYPAFEDPQSTPYADVARAREAAATYRRLVQP